ncbi:hypothetical protein RB595_003194 [Gaeumannomyces hyphopodioides]
MSDATPTFSGSRPVFTGGPPPPGWVEENGRIIPFWWSRTGHIIKWSLFLGIFTIFALYIVIGYWHAKKRLSKGQIPLAYHRWLVSRSQLARVDPRYAYPQPAGYTTYRPDYYGMNAMPPPPVYEPSRPPMYDGPPGGTKVDPAQTSQQSQAQPPPPPPQEAGIAGPQVPPPTVTANHTGSSNNPFRR